MITEFATAEQIQAYNEAIGRPTLGSPNPFHETDSSQPQTFDATLFAQANARSNNHVRIKYFNNFKRVFLLNKDGSDNLATTLEELQDDVRAALQEAVSIGSPVELENPNAFKAIFTAPTSGQELKKAASGAEFFPSSTGKTVIQLSDARGQDQDIHDLLDKYLLVPQHTQNQTNICPDANGECPGLGIFFAEDC